MRAVVIRTDRLIQPFGEPPHQAAFAAVTVGDTLNDALARRGITRVDIGLDDPLTADGPTLVLADFCFVTDKCLGDFLDRALDVVSTTVDARLALAQTAVVDFVRPVSSIAVEPFDASGPGAKQPSKGFASKWENEATARCAFDCFLTQRAFPSGRAALTALRAEAKRVVVPKKELGIPLRLPILGDTQHTRSVVPITSTVAAHLEHWVHVLWLNQLAFGVRWMEIARRHKLWCLWRVVVGLLGMPSVPRLMRAFVKKGRGVRIHPTAHVEASILGDGVVIGARASVRNSIIGANTEIGDHATVLSSVLGADCFITPRTFVVWCATYASAVLSNYKIQVSLVGRGASLSTWAGLIDAKLQGSVDVMHDGQRRSTEKSFLGSCIGHGAYIGAKVLILPGREVPNGAMISMRPDELVLVVPAHLAPGVPHVRDGGTLVPLAQLTQAKVESALSGHGVESSTSASTK